MAEGRDPTRLTVIAAVVLLCAGAVVLIVMILVGADSNDTGARALGTALTSVFFLLTATAGATQRSTRWSKGFGIRYSRPNRKLWPP